MTGHPLTIPLSSLLRTLSSTFHTRECYLCIYEDNVVCSTAVVVLFQETRMCALERAKKRCCIFGQVSLRLVSRAWHRCFWRNLRSSVENSFFYCGRRKSKTKVVIASGQSQQTQWTNQNSKRKPWIQRHARSWKGGKTNPRLVLGWLKRSMFALYWLEDVCTRILKSFVALSKRKPQGNQKILPTINHKPLCNRQ